jgi:hypothetical protein
LVIKIQNKGASKLKLPTKLSTIVNKMRLLSNEESVNLVLKFYEFAKENDGSENTKTII